MRNDAGSAAAGAPDAAAGRIEFETEPGRYRHWRLAIDGRIATLSLDVAEDGGLRDDYTLKLNSYDLGVDIELADAIQRLRFEHPRVAAVIVTSGKPRMFCAGANIRMLAGSSHDHKVNFCKFTNETRAAIEDASAHSGQTYIARINGPCAGGGYELAMACEELVMADDGNTSVSLPEVPLLAVLPGTGGLTRLTDKRRVRRDLADVFCTVEEGVRGRRAVDWRLVDEVARPSVLDEAVARRAAAATARSDRPADATGVALGPLRREVGADRLRYSTLEVEIDREVRAATFTIAGPDHAAPGDGAAALAEGDRFWPLRLARELDDAMLHLRLNEATVGTWVFRSRGDLGAVESHDALLADAAGDWFIREVRLFWARVLRRLDLSARSLFALIEPESCFAGTLFEIVLAADRSFMLLGGFEGDNRPPAVVRLGPLNFGAYPIVTGLSRIQARFFEDAGAQAAASDAAGRELDAEAAEALGLITFAPDDIDWQDEVRIAIEERAAFSPDALTGLEASLRFPGPETMESKIYARLSAWQNWIFQRPNAVGEDGALPLYGSGRRPRFDQRRA